MAKATPALRIPALIASLASGLLVGCTSSTYTVDVDAISHPTKTVGDQQAGVTYHIKEDGLRSASSELRSKEVSDFIRTALSGKGMYEALSPEQADVIISVDFGMEAPRIKFDTMTKPVFVETKDQITVGKEPIRDPSGTIIGYRDVTYVIRPGGSEFLGMDSEVVPKIVYEKYLKLSARENVKSTEGRAPVEVWSVNVSAEDGSMELRKYLPILVTATADYIGTNTKVAVPVKIGENDEAVKFVKRGL